MMIKLRLLAVLLVLLLITACHPNTPVSESPEPSVPESIRPPVTVLYPDALPEGAAETAAYREAVERGMLLCGDQPATDAALVEWFLSEVEAGRDAELAIATFAALEDASDGSVRVDCFTNRSDGLYLTYAYTGWNDPIVFDPEEWEVKGLYLNDYGCLVYDIPGMTGPLAHKVLHDRAIYPNYDEAGEMYDTYLRPIFYTALGGSEWNDPGEIGSWLWLYEDISNYERINPFDHYGSDWPVEVIVETLSRYFEGITREDFLSSNRKYDYDAATDTIHYEGGRGGGPKPLRVLDWTETGDLLEIRYFGYDYTTNVPSANDYLLTIRKMPDGSFRYLSNSFAPYVNRLARDDFLDPEQLQPDQNNLYFTTDQAQIFYG